jgi:hypothetical protein
MPLKLVHKIEREETISNSFSEVNIALIPKPGKDTTKKENYRLISLLNIDTKFSIKYMETKFNST